jgi:hypothetical protein
MASLTHQRCFNHFQREAVARCTGCRQFFCRECITEHDDRVVCSACLLKLAKVPLTKRRGFAGTMRTAQFLFSLVLLWFFFYLIGEGLLSIPTAFHDGTLWHASWLDTK